MGILSEFFVASEEDALQYGASNLLMTRSAMVERYQAAEWKGITELELSGLWALIANEPSDPDRFEIPLVQMENDNEAWLYRLPESFVAALSGLTDAQIEALATAWVRSKEAVMDRWEAADARRLLSDLRKLAGRARRTGLGMYMWGSL